MRTNNKLEITLSDYIEESLVEQNKKIEELKEMSVEERQFAIFKMFYNGLSTQNGNLLTAATKKYPFTFLKLNTIMDKANQACRCREISEYNRYKICAEIMMQYKSLLEKISILAKELNINNSLELSILFSYLLWNGYLSKEKDYTFQAYNRKTILGLLFIDIIDGIGVCLNHAEMLKDILNYCGYKSSIIINHFDYYTKVEYKLDIKRNGIKDSNNIIKEILNKQKANHAFNLIEENDNLYIYDSTNLLIYNIVSSDCANLTLGKGENKLFPYQSYGLCVSEEEVRLLDKLHKDDSLPSQYTKEDFISTGEVNIEIIKNSTSLLEDFYTEVHPNITAISEETEKIKVKTK